MLDILRELELLLSKHGYHGQAAAVERIIRFRQVEDRKAFVEAVTGLSVWGGSGSVADVDLRHDPPTSAAEAPADVRRFRGVMIALADALEHEGLGTVRTRDVAATFRSWAAQGV